MEQLQKDHPLHWSKLSSCNILVYSFTPSAKFVTFIKSLPVVMDTLTNAFLNISYSWLFLRHEMFEVFED